MLKILQTLFPKFAWYTGGFYLKWEESTELRYKKIASSEKINIYFDLSIESIPISQEKSEKQYILMIKIP